MSRAPSCRVLRRSPGVCLLAALLGTACGSETDTRPAAWEYLSPAVFQPNCASVSCHSRAAAAAGLDFSDPDRGYTSLTGLWVWIVDKQGTPEQNCRWTQTDESGVVVCQRAFRPMVTPFIPGQSRVVHMLRAQGASRMPPDRPLPEADLSLIERLDPRRSAPPPGRATDAGARRRPRPAGARRGSRRVTSRGTARALAAAAALVTLATLLGTAGYGRGLPAVAVQHRRHPLQPVPLRPRGRRAAERLRPRRRRRGAVDHRGRRRVPARQGRAALAPGAGRRPAGRAAGPRRPGPRRRHPGGVPHAGWS